MGVMGGFFQGLDGGGIAQQSQAECGLAHHGGAGVFQIFQKHGQNIAAADQPGGPAGRQSEVGVGMPEHEGQGVLGGQAAVFPAGQGGEPRVSVTLIGKAPRPQQKHGGQKAQDYLSADSTTSQHGPILGTK